MAIEKLYRVTCDNCGKVEVMEGPQHLSASYIITKSRGWKMDDYGEYHSQECMRAAQAKRSHEYEDEV